jgi:hypothetical protein
MRIGIIGDVPDELAEQFLQHVRDFDAAHEGCHFDIMASTEMGTEAVKALLGGIDPAFDNIKVLT